MLYLSPVWHTLQPNMRHKFGYMQNLYNGGVSEAIKLGYPWMLDNGAFSEKWIESKWIEALDIWKPYVSSCIAAVCPDVVGDHSATLVRFFQYAPVISQYGYRVAFVTQDGATTSTIPWGSFSVLFIGGTDKHKLYEAWDLIEKAREMGLWIHVGRVNSFKRIEMFWMADSVDGTTLAIEPSIRNQMRIINGISSVNAKKRTIPLCFT